MHTVFAHSVHMCTHTMCTTSTYCLSHVCAWCTGSVHGVNVQYMVCTFCGLCGSSVHGVHVLWIMWKFCAWCTRSVHGVDVLCMVCTFCAWCKRSVHGVHVLWIMWKFCAWCARSVDYVEVLCMVYTFCAWCGRSVHGVHVLCMEAVSPLALVRHVSNHYAYTCTCTLRWLSAIVLLLSYNFSIMYVVVLELHSIFCQRAN